MKVKEMFRKHKKKIIIILVILVVVLVAVGVALFWWLNNRQGNDSFGFGGMQGGGGKNITVTEDMIAATGVTSVGLIEETFDVENLTTGLEIEEIYIASEETIEEGTKVLKLSEESIAEAREELEETLKQADLAYRAGAIEYEQSLITAEYDRDSKLLSGEQAQAVYDETVAGLKDSLERAQEAVTEAQEQIAEYQSYVSNDSYREYFKVDEYQAVYDENLDVLKERMEEWGITWPQVTGQGGGSMSRNASGAGLSEDEEHVRVLAQLYSILEKNREELDNAIAEYEDALTNASLNMQTLQLELPGLKEELAEAEKNYETQILQAKVTYETSLANAESAESDYETAVQKAESDYETLKDDWEDAKENLELFENTVGDGYFYASGSGTVLRTMVRAGQNLTSEGVILMYSNPADMSVTVSVDQADIAKVALGDSVYIQSTENGGFEGTVTAINPVSNSSSRTSVTYEVTVQFGGDSTALGANESVTVIFGMEMRESR